MLTFTYDGTAEGLFSAFETALIRNCEPQLFTADSVYNGDLFNANEFIPTNPDLAASFGTRLRQIDESLPGQVIQVFMAATKENVETIIFRYCLLSLRHGRTIGSNLTDIQVWHFQSLARQVQRETHRFKGLLRFEELDDGLLWASYEPVNNITTLLAPHFIRRLPNDKWLICDVGRGEAVYWNREKLQPAAIEGKVLKSLRQQGKLPGRTAEGDGYAELWRSYFNRISISERKNTKLQKQFMPKRFWRWLPEKMPVLSKDAS